MSKGTALITGASSGIGAELAALCAGDAYDVVLVARRADRLEGLAGKLAKDHGIQARAMSADLADPRAPVLIHEGLRGSAVDILINNAGFGIRGPFAETDWDTEARMVQVNVVALAHLTKLVLPEMVRRRSGRILNVASTAGFVPGPFMAMYYASKAFVVSFTESIANELEGTGVSATVLCPGPTRTEFAEAAGVAKSNLFKGPVMSAAEVARIGYGAMMQGKAEVIAGARNLWTMRGARLLPRMKVAGVTRRMNTG
jgi:short-subunit dehydrogenase